MYYFGALEFVKWELTENATPINQCILTRIDRIEEYNIFVRFIQMTSPDYYDMKKKKLK